MWKRTTVMLVALCAVAGAMLAYTATPANPETPKTAWKVVGQLEEACSCSAACPCWFGSKPTKMACSGGQFIFIEKGHYGSVKLDGLGVGAMSKSPDGKGMMESFGNWDFNYYYIDEKATPEQRDALKALAKTVLVPNASPKEEIRFVPLTRTITGKEHKISLGTYGHFSGHLIEGGLGGATKITNPPGADPLHHEYSQGQTTTMAFNDASQDWKFEGSNYMFGTFELDNEQYERFAAGLAQKMAAMKK
jgi:hypothetical protein